ncbi:MAG: phage portal protein [Hyphomicrobiales bacterium]|nr:MAG: phage portal protein [Hyphomicrobiales bacterium]
MAAGGASPRAAVQDAGGGKIIATSDDLSKAIANAVQSIAGPSVTADSAMRVAAVYACIRIIAGAVANLPLSVMRRIDDKTREEASDHPLWRILRKRPNRWQTPSQFKRMMQAHLLLRGTAYAMISRSRGMVQEIIPLHPDRVTCKQADDFSLVYEYRRKDGGVTILKQAEVMHLVGLSLDGVHGVSVLEYARETVGLSLAMEQHGASTFKNGLRPSSVLKHPKHLGKEGQEFLRASLEAFRSGGDSEGKSLILEEGMDIAKLSMTAEDAQWIESRKFTRADIAMFFGVPPHMLGDTEKTTSWGSGIEQQSIGFVTYTLEDHLTTWEESADRDLVSESDKGIYTRFNRKALVRGDIKSRQAYYVAMLTWGVLSPDEVRALEDQNPRPDGRGGEYYDPPNTAGAQPDNTGETSDEPAPSA